MSTKEWFEQSGYEYKIQEYDEGGYLGIDENKVAEMLDEHFNFRLKSLIKNTEKIIEKVSEQHPYKEIGNINSYNQYNEGWSDACDIIKEKINKINDI